MRSHLTIQLHDIQVQSPWLEPFTSRITSRCKLVVPTIECGKTEGTMSIRPGLWPSAAKKDRDVPNPEAHMFATDRVRQPCTRCMHAMRGLHARQWCRLMLCKRSLATPSSSILAICT